MKTIRKIMILGMAAALLFSSCEKSQITETESDGDETTGENNDGSDGENGGGSNNDTPDPETGVLLIDLQKEEIRDECAIVIGQLYGSIYPQERFEAELPPGTFDILIFRITDGFAYDFEKYHARVQTPEEYEIYEKSCVRNDDITDIIPMPDYLYTYSREITIEAGDTIRINASAEQRVRDLHLEFTVTQGRPELIQTVTGTLSGIAGTFDIKAGETVGESVSTTLDFTLEDDKLTADARLLGTLGEKQMLDIHITFSDRSRRQHIEVDMTEALAEFNDKMDTGLEVSGTIETPAGVEEGTAEITGWKDADSFDVDADF